MARLAARLAGVTVVGHGRTRSLRVTVRVSVAARAQVRLLQRGFERAQKLVRRRPGSNPIRLALPAGLKRGTYRLSVVIRAGAQQTTATALVVVEGGR